VAASHFLTVEVWTGRGLVTHYLLLVISLADRVVNIAGITTRPDESWMLQVARKRNRFSGWLTSFQAISNHWSRYEVLGAISSADSRQWSQGDPAAATILESVTAIGRKLVEKLVGAGSLGEMRIPS